MQVSVARYLRTPPYTAKRKDLSFGYPSCLSSQSDRSTVVVCNCTFAPITVVAHRDKANIFRRSSILFRPHTPQTKENIGGAAGYRPRVRSVYYMRVYVHSSRVLPRQEQDQHRGLGRAVQGVTSGVGRDGPPYRGFHGVRASGGDIWVEARPAAERRSSAGGMKDGASC